jgi:hypothetical protein
MRQIGFMNEEVKKTRVNLNTVYSYLHEYNKKTGRFPRVKTVSNDLKVTQKSVNEAFNRLEKAKKIRKAGTYWEVTDSAKLAELNRAKGIDSSITSKELEVIKVVVKVFALVVATFLAALSVRFTYLQYKDIIGWFWGLLASIAIVGTLLLAYQVKLILVIKSKAAVQNDGFWKKLLSSFNPQVWLFRLIFFVALGISISSTIFTQVGGVLRNRENTKLESSENVNNNTIYNNLKTEIEELKKAITENDKNRNHYREQSAKAKINSQAWRDSNWWLNRYEKESKVLVEKLQTKNTEINELLASDIVLTNNVETYEIYEWLEKVTRKSKRFFELFLAVLFAIFIDIAAPLLLSVALITRRK